MNHKSYFGLKLNANNLEIKGEVFNFCATHQKCKMNDRFKLVSPNTAIGQPNKNKFTLNPKFRPSVESVLMCITLHNT